MRRKVQGQCWYGTVRGEKYKSNAAVALYAAKKTRAVPPWQYTRQKIHEQCHRGTVRGGKYMGSCHPDEGRICCCAVMGQILRTSG